MPEWSKETFIGRLVKGRYRIVRLVGRGAMGNVYEVLHEGLHSAFALKQLRADLDSEPAVVARFRHEAEMMAGLSHPNIVRVFDIDTEPGFGTWMAMELVHGEDLGAVMRRHGRLSIDETARIGGQIAAALDCAHRAGLVHRDIKPGNVLIEAETGRAVLTDFGIAKSVGTHDADGATRTGMFVGTYRYSSPEQIRNQHGIEIDGRADLYSLGVVLYEMLSGKKFLVGLSESEIVSEVGFRADWTPPLLYDEAPPAALGELVACCLAPRRDQRIASAGEISERLAGCAAVNTRSRLLIAGAFQRPASSSWPGVASPDRAAKDLTAATVAPAFGPEAARAGVAASAPRIRSAGPLVAARAPQQQRRRSRRPWRALGLVVLATAGIAAWAGSDRVKELLGSTSTADAGIAIQSVQPNDKMVALTRRDPQWFSVVLDGVDPGHPPAMRWYLNDQVVAENTTVWEYEPKTHLAALTARGVVRFEVGRGRGARQTHTWATQTSTKDLSPVLLSASYKPGSTIPAKIGEAVAIEVDAYDPDGDPLSFTWLLDGRRVGRDEPRLTVNVAGNAKLSLAISDGDATVSSSWLIAVTTP